MGRGSRQASPAGAEPRRNIQTRIGAREAHGSLSRTDIERLPRVATYLGGIAHRIERLAENVGRDRTAGAEVQQATELLTRAGGTLPLPSDAPARLVTARWMLEELRISLFAQPLGAHGPISVPRIRKALEG